jgi:hypothetical protein
MRAVFVALVITAFSSSKAGECQVAEPETNLDELLTLYRKLDLPLPPPEAKLVSYESGGAYIINKEVQPPSRSLAFRIKHVTKPGSVELLTGASHNWKPSEEERDIREVAADPSVLKSIHIDTEDAFLMAIQCQSRNWGPLARELLSHSKEREKRPGEAARERLLRLGWEFAVSHLSEPDTDRKPIARKLKAWMAEYKELQTKGNQSLLRSLELALVPSKAKPGSVEALIDDLVNYHARTGTIGVFLAKDDRFERIARLGFEAVPSLIEHLDDDRLTRGIMTGFNNFKPWNLRVRHLVSDLLQGLSGKEQGRDWLDRQKGGVVDKEQAKKWWEQASKVGEEAYLLSHVLPEKAEKENAQFPNTQQLTLIQAKYPKHIPALYKRVLEKQPYLESWPLAEVIEASKLSTKEQLDLFEPAILHAQSNHRLPALWAIKKLDKKRFDAHLLSMIEAFPKDVSETYWTCSASVLGRNAIESYDPRIWPVLEKVAKRSSRG